jgi:hypothetical protein
MPLPDFLIIGAQKAGTTSLYTYLKQHEAIFFPEDTKETHFFKYWRTDRDQGEGGVLVEAPTSLDEYRALFEDAQPDALAGEASPSYLCSKQAVQNIQELIPDVRMIAVLRNPIERSFSNYLHALRHWEEPMSFGEAIRNEERRIENGLPPHRHYKRKGMYAQQLRRYYDAFDRDQIHVLLSEDLWSEPTVTVRGVFSFLGVDPNVELLDTGRQNASGLFRNEGLRHLYDFLKKEWRSVKPYIPNGIQNALHSAIMERPEMKGEDRKYLRSEYKKEIRELEKLIDRDLDHWVS